MQIDPIPYKKTLNKAYLRLKPNRADIERFKAGLARLLDRIDHEESEENAKNHLRDFLNDVWYNNIHLVNTKGRTDLVIHEDKSAQSRAAVLFEVKRPRNAADMISSANPNAKALHELLLYYLRERIDNGNTDIKYLIVTNVYEWYIFEAAAFDRLFYESKLLRGAYEDWKSGRKTQSGTDFFYREIAWPFLDQLDAVLSPAYFNFRDFEKILRNADPADDVRLIALFKILSPPHLLRLPFANDSNSLDRAFYHELLYILGLEEQKVGGKKLIQRCAPERRRPGSLVENAIATLISTDRLRSVPRLGDYGADREEQLFGVALELCITWTNRLLFLKLLEAQLVKYHSNKQYAFLQSKLLHDFDEVNELFFEVLAKLPDERPEYAREKFLAIPYLNSSLFEISELEAATIFISNLKDRFRIAPMPGTVLKDAQGRRRSAELGILEYLFAFLDAYDFASEGSEDIQEENKTLINASVLGLIFEKLNGYRDGAFFTPGFITMYMARETVRRAIVQRCNAHYGIGCDDFEDLRNFAAQKYRKEDVLEFNRVINGLRICDPAVGSGHFLVSALNEIIAAKSELGILADREGVVLRGYEARVENDELIVTANDGLEFFEYRVHHGRAGQEAQRVQETLFHEKQTLIENCLFGVDINPNSAKICRLRLWIELLKNTYYIQDTRHASSPVQTGHALSPAQPPAQPQLETLPNIDINIKTGNSLISRYALDADLKQALKKSNYSMDMYRTAVQQYRHATDSEQKRELLRLIGVIKSDFRSEIGRNDPKRKRLDKLVSELYHRFTGNFLFEPEAPYGESEEELEKKRRTEKEKLEQEIGKLQTEIEEINQNKIFDNAFEWRFEFPEVLDDEGNFMGFDIVMGNPPYIRQEEFSALKPYLQSQFQTYAGTADLLVYFIELGMRLLRPEGLFHFIVSNKFMRAGFGKPLRQWMQQYRILEILDFGDLPVFDEATTYPCTLQLHKTAPTGSFMAANIPALETAGFRHYVRDLRFRSEQSALDAEGWNLSDSRVQRLLEKLKQTGVPLGEYVQGKIYYGIKTGLNEAFVIDEAVRERLIAEDPRSAEIIKPFLAGRDIKRYMPPKADKYLIFTRRGIAIENYPAILRHLEQYKERLMPQPKDWTGKIWPGRKPGTYKWYEIQDAVDYYEAFEKGKIIIPAIVNRPSYTYSNEIVYSNDKTSIIAITNHYLLGLLNSQAIDFIIQHISSTKRGGYFEYKPMYVSALPIVLNPELKIKESIESLVARTLAAKQAEPSADTAALEAEIDRLVYALYGLTEEEVAIVEGRG